MFNQISFVGHVGKNPETVDFPDTGNKVVKFSIAVKEYSNKSDEEKTMWLDVDAWNGLGDRVLKTVTKGREVIIEGKLTLNTYSKDVGGTQVKMTKPVIKLTDFHLCGSAPRKREEILNDNQLTNIS